MNKYNLFCTEEQTEKALELGAPIEFARIKDVPNTFEHKDILYKFPTAEQMIGWLEEQINVREICIQRYGNWWYQIYIDPYFHLEQQGFNTRKEATLAAIDAALEYLTKKGE